MTPLREKSPYAEFFLVCHFPYFDWMRTFTEKISLISPNAGKYRPVKISSFKSFTYFKLFRSCIIFGGNIPRALFQHETKFWGTISQEGYPFCDKIIDHIN